MNSVPATAEIPGHLVGTWKADPVHSEIAFSVRHLVISKTRGRFTSYDITLVTGEDLLGSSVTATIDLASIDTGHEMRDNHLRSADYLEIDKYPTMSYRSTGVQPTGAVMLPGVRDPTKPAAAARSSGHASCPPRRRFSTVVAGGFNRQPAPISTPLNPVARPTWGVPGRTQG
jgi:YceI-like protein